MANKKVNIVVDLDLTADKMSIDKIRSQMDMAFKAMKINLDPASYKKAESQLKELQRIAEISLNKNTGKINFKKMDTAILNSADIASAESLNKTLLQAGVNGTESLNKIANANQHLQKGIVSSNSLLTKMGTTLSNTIRWNISASAVNAVTGELQKSYYFAKDLDRVLTNIRIVSGESAERMADFAIAANKSAKELKVSTLDYAEASLVFFQQGLNAIEVQKMTEASIIGSNITGESTEVMSNLLTSVVNGYRMATDEVLDVTDKLAAVGASTAADFNELATAMSKVASMAKSAGVPIDELNAQIATIVSVTKESPESIGTSLKTIYGRMLAFKTDTKALMEDEDGETFGAPNVEAALQAYSRATGAQISLFKTTKDGKQELRDLGDVINEVGNSWDKTTDNVAKFGLATALAGSRQQNRLISLFNAWDQYKETVEVSLNAEGASLEQNQIYMDSYAGRLKGLQNAKEKLYMSFTDNDGLKDFISGLTAGVELITKLSEAAGGLNAILGIAGSALVSHGMPKLLLNADKFKDIIPKGSGKTDSDKEALEIKKQLHAIEKVHGAEVANNLRLKIKAAKEESFINKKTLQETQEQFNMMQSMAEASDKRKKSNFDTLTQDSSLGKEQLLLVQTQLDRYNELTEQRKKLDAIGPYKILADADPKILKDIELTEQNILQLETAIDEVNNSLDETARKFSKMSNLSESKTQGIADNIEEQAKRAEQIHKVTMLTQTAMMLLPSAISAATDDTKDYLDILGAVGSMGLILIPNIASEIISTAIATGGLTAATKTLGLALKTTFLPLAGIGLLIAGIGALIKFVDKSIVTFKEQKKIVDELSDSVKSLQSEYDALSANTNRTAEQEEYLNLLKKELEIKKDSLKIEAEALEKDYFAPNKITGYDDSEAAKVKKQIEDLKELREEREKLNKTMSAEGYEENQDDIDKMKELKQNISELELSLVGSQKELKQIGKDLGEPTARMRSLSDEIDKTIYTSEELFEKNRWAVANEIAERIATGEKATDGWQRSLESLGFTSEEALAILAGNIEDVKNGLDDLKKPTENIATSVSNTIAKIDEFASSLSSLDSAYAKLKDKNQLTASDLVSLQETFGETKGFEAFVDVVGTASSLTGEVQKAFDTLLGSYLETSDVMDTLTEDNKDLIVSQLELVGVINAEEIATEILSRKKSELAAQEEALALEKAFVTEKGYELVDATWDEINALINQEGASEDTRVALARLALEKITLNNNKLDFNSDIDQIIALANAAGASQTALMNLQNAKNILNGVQSVMDGASGFHQFQDAEKIREKVLNGVYDYQFGELNSADYKKPIYGGGGQSNKGGGQSNKGGGSKSAKEDYKALADRYAKINQELDKNNVLLAKNKTLQNLAGDDTAKRIELMEEEIKLNEDRQKLLNNLNNERRKEMQELEKSLSKFFNFEGVGDNRIITNLEDIQGKSKEVETDFKRYIELQSSLLPQASQEWWNLKSAIESTGRSIQDTTRDLAKSVVEMEKQIAYADLEVRQREAQAKLDKAKARMERDIADLQSDIDGLQSEIDRIQEQEKARQERLERNKRLAEINQLEAKYYFLQNKNLANLSEEQAKLLGLEEERERYLERQIKLQELQIQLTNTMNEKNIQQLTKKEDGTWDFIYVADQDKIDDINKQIENTQKEHSKSIEKLKETTLDSLQKAQESYDEWERQNEIQRTIEAKQRRIQRYQDEIKDLQDKFAEKEKRTNKAFAVEKENLDRFYTNMDALTNTKLQELHATFGDNWTAIYGTLTGFFGQIANEYDKLAAKLSTPLPTPSYSAGGQGFYTPSSGGGGSSGKISGNPSVDAAKYAIDQNIKDWWEADKRGDDAAKKKASEQADKIRKETGLNDYAKTKDEVDKIKKKYGFLAGGETRKTGLHWLDGEVGKPERILSAQQTKDFNRLVANMPSVLSGFDVMKNLLPKINLPNLNNYKSPIQSNGGDQIFHIHKLEFPNVHDAKEIETSIRTLSTYADQWANQK